MAERVLRVKQVVDCDRCDGTGWRGDNRCWKCHQTGWMTKGGVIELTKTLGIWSVTSDG